MIKGAGGAITDWRGQDINWEASADSRVTGLTLFLFSFLFVLYLCHKFCDTTESENLIMK